MSDHHNSIEEECNKQDAILGIAAPIIVVMILAAFILFMNTRFTGNVTDSEASGQSMPTHSDNSHHE